jgi:hypothetical protein
MTKQYTWNTSMDAEWWDYGIFESIEECIEDSKNYEVTDSIFVGEVEPYEINVDADRVLEDLEQDASDECGEAAEGWCPSYDIERTEIDHLSAKLTNIVRAWLKQQNYLPHFYNIINIREVDVNSGSPIGSMF